MPVNWGFPYYCKIKESTMKNTLNICCTAAILACASLIWQGCSKSSSSSTTNTNNAVALTIQTGAQTLAPGGSLSYSALLVDKNGNTTSPSNVSWSVAGAGGSSIGSFTGSNFTANGVGYGVITATANVGGQTFSASVPIGVYTAGIFTVVPSAVIWSTNAGTIQLSPVYLGIGTTGYSYTSSDASVASVDGSGNITFNKAGQCVITVTASGLSGTPQVSVPVLVVGNSPASLPISRVAVTPATAEMFRGGTKSFSAKAYDANGNAVSGSFTWASQNSAVATVDQSGTVTAVALGKAVITATASGITGQAEVDVLPDTTIIVSPIWASVAPGATFQFTASAYKVDHSSLALTPITYSGITWQIPSFGIPAVDSLFGIATVDATGKITMKSTATVGMSSFVMAMPASAGISPGVGLLSVSDCSCGTTDAGVTNITGVPATTSLSLTSGGTYQINATAVNSTGGAVSGATLHYCSNSMTVCTVDSSTGFVTAVGPGTATITVCDGSVQVTMTVTVTL